jgi:L-malate glycosyltransferase
MLDNRHPSGPSSELIRVCHIAHGDLWAGAEVQLATLLEALIGIQIFEISAILLNEGRLAAELRKTGIPVKILSEVQYNSAQLLLRLVRHLKSHRPHIIHTHKYKDNILGSAAAVMLSSAVVVRTVHGMTEPFSGIAHLKMMGYDLLDRIATTFRVKKLVAVSTNIESVLRRMYGHDKVIGIHNGIDLETVRSTSDRKTVRENLGIGDDEYVVGTVGRLTPVKGHETLLRVAALLKERGKLRYLIVGDGPLMQRLVSLTRELGMEREVILAGQRHDVYDLIHCMDVFVLPSVHEGIPMVLLEALALNCPVVASRVGGIPEVIEHRTSGLLVEPGNMEELKGAIERLMDDKPFADELAMRGRRRVEEEFSAALMAQRTADLYYSLI